MLSSAIKMKSVFLSFIDLFLPWKQSAAALAFPISLHKQPQMQLAIVQVVPRQIVRVSRSYSRLCLPSNTFL